MNASWFAAGLLAAMFGTADETRAAAFYPGKVWPDTQGAPIQAHGGGILVRSNLFYWHGEDRTPGGTGAVSCYSSTNLYDWKREGVALSREALPRVDGRGTFAERPKVIFNPATGKYVMWMHLEQGRYLYARAGIATSESAIGPFIFLQALRPIADGSRFPADDRAGQDKLGGTYRDMNLFVDDDGAAYAFYASEDNWTMYVVRLNREFTGPEVPAVEGKTWARILVRKMREAPAPFKYRGRYYLVTSGCTGWTPNAADWAVSDHVLGPYESKGNPCVGPEAEITYRSQSTFVLPMPGKPGNFIFMADRWNNRDLPDSRYVWLPMVMRADGSLTIEWHDAWDLASY